MTCNGTLVAGHRAAEVFQWGDGVLGPRDPLFRQLHVADGYAPAETPFIQCQTGFPHGTGIGSEATARMGYRFIGAEMADFIDVSGTREAKAIISAAPKHAVAMARVVGDGGGRTVMYEVLGPSGRPVAAVAMQRNLSARRSGGDLFVAYSLDLQCYFAEAVPAAEKFIASYVIGRLACAHLDNDVSCLVYDLEEANTPAFMSFAITGTRGLGHAAEAEVTEFVSSVLSDFHDWFLPAEGKEDLLKPFEACTDMQGFMEDPDDYHTPPVTLIA